VQEVKEEMLKQESVSGLLQSIALHVEQDAGVGGGAPAGDGGAAPAANGAGQPAGEPPAEPSPEKPGKKWHPSHKIKFSSHKGHHGGFYFPGLWWSGKCVRCNGRVTCDHTGEVTKNELKKRCKALQEGLFGPLLRDLGEITA